MDSCKSRRSRFQFVLVSVLILSTTGLLSGCGLVAPTQEPVTISFAHPAVDSDFYQKLADTFHEKYSYITIDLQPNQSQDFGWINAGEADTFVNTQFALGELLDRDLVLDLTPFISENRGIQPDDFYTHRMTGPGTTFWPRHPKSATQTRACSATRPTTMRSTRYCSCTRAAGGSSTTFRILLGPLLMIRPTWRPWSGSST